MWIARKEGLLIGLSAGAVTYGFKVVKEVYGPGVYVLIYPDDIFKYIEAIKAYLEDIGEL